MRLIHLSDTHFHQDPAANADVMARLAILAKDDFINYDLIVTGDITDDGAEKQYRNAVEAFTPFKGRIWLCPGNHDYGPLGMVYDIDKAKYFDSDLLVHLPQGGTFLGSNTPVVNVIENVMLIGLDSCCETVEPWDFACGEIGELQLKHLKFLLDNNPNLVKVVYLHHHPLIVNDPFMELKDCRAFWKAVYNKADAILFGHKHVPHQWINVNGVKILSAAANLSNGLAPIPVIVIENGKITWNMLTI